jgi:hypothetical protein
MSANAVPTLAAGPVCDTCLGTGRVGTATKVIPCPDCAATDQLMEAMTYVSSLNQPVHPVDALVEVAAQMFPGQEMNPEQREDAVLVHPVDAFVYAAERWFPGKQISEELLVQARVWCDTPVCSTCGGAGEIDERLGGIATSGIVPCPDCTDPSPKSAADRGSAGGMLAFAEESDFAEPDPGAQAPLMVSNPYEDAETDQKVHSVSPEVGAMLQAQAQQIADLEAKLDAERTLRAQASAELEREKALERDRRIQADVRARDALWALDAAIEALTPLAGYATEEDGRVAGMTAPVCLAMSSVRRADAMVKLHRALRR